MVASRQSQSLHMVILRVFFHFVGALFSDVSGKLDDS